MVMQSLQESSAQSLQKFKYHCNDVTYSPFKPGLQVAPGEEGRCVKY